MAETAVWIVVNVATGFFALAFIVVVVMLVMSVWDLIRNMYDRWANRLYWSGYEDGRREGIREAGRSAKP